MPVEPAMPARPQNVGASGNATGGTGAIATDLADSELVCNRLRIIVAIERGGGASFRGLSKKIVHLKVNAVGPAKTDDIALVAGSYIDVCGAVDDVVLLADGAVAEEIVEDGPGELGGDA